VPVTMWASLKAKPMALDDLSTETMRRLGLDLCNAHMAPMPASLHRGPDMGDGGGCRDQTRVPRRGVCKTSIFWSW